LLHRLDEKGKSESHNIEQRSVYLRGKIVAICEAILREEMGAIAGSRVLNKLEIELLHHATFGWFTGDEDFLVFVAIDSETDHLPVDFERHNWSTESLQQKDQEVIKAEQWAKEFAFPACKKLIERFRFDPDI
jgi:hypothetical protein